MRVPVLSVLFAAALAMALPAQRGVAGGSGLWYSAGAGPAWARVTCRICRGQLQGGMGGFLRLGGAVKPRLLIGAEVAAWSHGSDQVDESAWAVSAAGYWYPARARHYFKAGLGYSVHEVDDGVDVVSARAVGPQVGAGYEFRAGEHWRVTPFVNASFAMVLGKIKFNGGVAAEDGNVTILQIGVAALHR